jgi:hypothetical protein
MVSLMDTAIFCQARMAGVDVCLICCFCVLETTLTRIKLAASVM